MPVELVTYGSDRRLELSGAEAVRKMFCEDDWTTLRIGLQICFNNPSATIFGGPQFRFGVCSGSSNVMVALSATHVVGVGPSATAGTQYTYSAGPPTFFSHNNNSLAFKKVGTTVTSVAFGLTNVRFTANSTVRSGMFCEITKGSPNYAVSRVMPSADASAQTDLTDALFLSAMQAGTMSNVTTVISAGGGGSYANLLVNTLPVNEGTDGPLDHLFVYWDRTVQKLSFNVRYRKIA